MTHPQGRALGEIRAYPDLLSEDEKRELLTLAEHLWADLQDNNLGGYSGINRPFWIVYQIEVAIEKFGRRDVGLSWSDDELRAALSAQEEKKDV